MQQRIINWRIFWMYRQQLESCVALVPVVLILFLKSIWHLNTVALPVQCLLWST